MKELTVEGVLGKCSAFMYVIEFQKRSLPHAHILFVAENDRLHTADDVDNVIRAELPPDPMIHPEGSLREHATQLEALVLKNMIHSCSQMF